jgi:hypothetical protein
MSMKTRKPVVCLTALTSEEIDNLMRILPTVLLQIGVNGEYIKPFVLFIRYQTELEQIRSNSTEEQCNRARRWLQRFVEKVIQLDYDVNNEPDIFDTITSNNTSTNPNDDDDDSHEMNDESDTEEEDDAAQEDEEEDDDEGNQPNWLFPKILVR